MNKILGGALAIGVTISFVAAPLAVQAEPLMLTEIQMDRVTAGGVLVSVEPYAAAYGDFGTAETFAQTNAGRTALFDYGYGFGLGYASACCGPDAAVDVATTIAGVGDTVGGGTATIIEDNGVTAIGTTVGWVAAFSTPPLETLGPSAQVFDQYTDRVTQELTAGIARHAQDLSEVIAAGGPPS